MPTFCITGTNRGLGLEFVRQLSASPANTILALVRGRDTDLTDLKAAIKAGGDTQILYCDTGKPESIQAFADEAKSLLAGKRIDVLVNNAGAHISSWQSSLSLDADDLLRTMQINVFGPAKMVQSLNAAELLSPQVRVINMTSGLASMTETLGSPGNTNRKCCPYSISKAALNMLSLHQSGDLRAKAGLSGAVVIVMDPGWVKTAMGGAGAILEPHQSISGMLRVIEGLTDADNGGFFSHSGAKKPW